MGGGPIKRAATLDRSGCKKFSDPKAPQELVIADEAVQAPHRAVETEPAHAPERHHWVTLGVVGPLTAPLRAL